MYEPDIEFRNHDNTVNKPAGMFKGVTVSLNNKIIKADLYVTESSGPPIIGRAWLKALGLWPLFKDLDLHIVKNKIDGSFNRAKIRLELKDDAKPIYELARSVPFALKDKIEKELDRLVEEKILEPVEMSEWATPIVPILKPNGDVRLCGAFNGLFKCLYMMYGISSGPGYFQKQIEEVLKNINGVAVVADDVVVTGSDDEEHLRNLDIVLTRLEECGLKGRVNKCEFFKDEVNYLGYKLRDDTITINEEKYRAIVDMKEPENHKELQLLLGKINYYGRLFKDRAKILAPLYNCSNSRIFEWDQNCKEAFERAKIELKSVLVNYNPSLPLKLTCDASPKGLGAYISQPYEDGDRPVAFASTRLTAAQENYSQIDKEAAAIIFGVTKFYDYLFGRKFLLKTDNKPLSRIFSPEKGIPKMATSRLQNWSYFLSAFDYEIEYISTRDNIVADTLSRLPINYVESNDVLETEGRFTYLHYVYSTNITCLNFKAVARETAKNETLSIVKRMVIEGWPDCSLKSWPNELQPYALRKDEIHVEKECLMWGQRVIVPPKLREKVIEKLHESHFGIVKMKSLARSVVWWPNIDKNLEDKSKYCKWCVESKDNPIRMELTPWPWPSQPWQRLHADFAGPYLGQTYLLVIDAYSKWPEIFIMKNISAEATIEKFREMFTTHGLPNHIVTDSGTQFTSDEYKKFLKQLGIKQDFSAPKHPATNGAAENLVKTFKRKLKAIVQSSKVDVKIAIQMFLFSYRTTKHATTNETPANLLFKRELKTPLLLLRPETRYHVESKQYMQKKHFKGSRKENFEEGDVIMAKDFRKHHPEMS
ncbi:uncharacterized protein K02A2.6 [Nasonia vitripennis]|uniref:RNA-directed DNA polymerase n=1 Tax=Nasonia vitripennis TaxID=7425 RepID=A0A7M7QGQ9_NASVI|nr:uncharacterized protein K02A2.6 [Nasonia vitripennis]